MQELDTSVEQAGPRQLLKPRFSTIVIIETIENKALKRVVIMRPHQHGAAIWNVRDVCFPRLASRECFAINSICKPFRDDLRLVGGFDIPKHAVEEEDNITYDVDACIWTGELPRY